MGQAVGWLDVGRLALDLVVPQQCGGCDRAGEPWCAACARECGTGPVPFPAPVPGWAAAHHDGPAGRAVVAFKEHGGHSLARPLGRLLASAIHHVVLDAQAAPAAEPLWLVPVPARRTARRARGMDHVGLLAGVAARDLRSLGQPAHRLAALTHIRPSRDQVGLSRAQRGVNVAGTLRAGGLPAGRVVVVDDVTTTGATLVEAVRAVTGGGAQVVGVATVTCVPTGGASLRAGPPDSVVHSRATR